MRRSYVQGFNEHGFEELYSRGVEPFLKGLPCDLDVMIDPVRSLGQLVEDDDAELKDVER